MVAPASSVTMLWERDKEIARMVKQSIGDYLLSNKRDMMG